jgi:hypothetical protein
MPRSKLSISPKCTSCSGLKNRLPGLPVIIEKFAVVGEILAIELCLLFLAWPLIDRPEEADSRDWDCNMASSVWSWRSIVILAGGTGNIEDVVLNRRWWVLEVAAGVEDEAGPS